MRLASATLALCLAATSCNTSSNEATSPPSFTYDVQPRVVRLSELAEDGVMPNLQLMVTNTGSETATFEYGCPEHAISVANESKELLLGEGLLACNLALYTEKIAAGETIGINVGYVGDLHLQEPGQYYWVWPNWWDLRDHQDTETTFFPFALLP